jgi:hypothetical protein
VSAAWIPIAAGHMRAGRLLEPHRPRAACSSPSTKVSCRSAICRRWVRCRSSSAPCSVRVACGGATSTSRAAAPRTEQNHPLSPRTPTCRPRSARTTITSLLRHRRCTGDGRGRLPHSAPRPLGGARRFPRSSILRLLEATPLPGRRSQHRCPVVRPAGDVRSFTLPFEMSTIQVSLYTYRRAIPAPAVGWFRGLVAEVLCSPPT